MKVRISTNAKTASRQLRRAVMTQIGRAALIATDEAGATARREIQGRMASARLGRLRGSVRYSSDRRNKRVPRLDANGIPALSWRAGSFVFVTQGSDRTDGAFQAYSQGALISPKGGRRWLAFPTKAIPKRVGRRKITPALYNASGLVRSIGPLQFVRGVSANVAYLVAKSVSVRNVTGTGAKALGKRGGAGSGRRKADFVVAFILIRTTARAKRFNPLSIVARQANGVPQRIASLIRGQGGGAVTGPIIFSSQGRGSGILVPVTRI